MPNTNERASVAQNTELNDKIVRNFLKENNDFLQRNPDMIDHLKIPHAPGNTVSLVERQATLLRERNTEIRHLLNTLSTNAKENDKLYEQTQSLVLQLLEATSISDLSQRYSTAMKQCFDIEYAAIILYGDSDDSTDECRVDDSNNPVSTLLRKDKGTCCTMREKELHYLFPAMQETTGSAAIMPLYDGEQRGLIAVGSSDAAHYGSDMGTLFLSHIADVIVRLLRRLPAEQAGLVKERA